MIIASKVRVLRRMSLVAFVPLVLGLYSPALLAAAFVVNSTIDAPDANPGDGVCETTPGNGVCTLRAAMQETRALAGADTIIVPSGVYQLTIPRDNTVFTDAAGGLITGGDLTVLGSGMDSTIIDGNGLDSVLITVPPGTVQLSGLTIRNGGNTRDGGGILNAADVLAPDVPMPRLAAL